MQGGDRSFFFGSRSEELPSRSGLQATTSRRIRSVGLAAFFVGLLPRLLAQCALKACGIRQDDALDPRRIDALARQLHAWKLPVQGSRGFAEAQVTIGGIDTADFDSASMQSWMVPGLYACGEVLDIDGDCGGYNLQWAWSSGRLAAVSAVSELLNV